MSEQEKQYDAIDYEIDSEIYEKENVLIVFAISEKNRNQYGVCSLSWERVKVIDTFTFSAHVICDKLHETAPTFQTS